MTDSIPTPVSLGFSEFTAKLISDTFDAIIVSLAEQEEKLGELTRLASSPEEFALTVVSDEEVDNFLAVRFTGDEEHLHKIYEGAPYQPLNGKILEDPPISQLLNVDLLFRDDYIKPRGSSSYTLTSSGVEKIRLSVRLLLSAERLAALRQVIRQGFPRLMVDTGRINAKLTFEVTQESEDDQSGEAALEASSGVTSPTGTISNGSLSVASPTLLKTQLLSRYSGFVSPLVASGIRLAVHQVDAKAPQVGQTKVNIFSEVEITFKTIT